MIEVHVHKGDHGCIDWGEAADEGSAVVCARELIRDDMDHTFAPVRFYTARFYNSGKLVCEANYTDLLRAS